MLAKACSRKSPIPLSCPHRQNARKQPSLTGLIERSAISRTARAFTGIHLLN